MSIVLALLLVTSAAAGEVRREIHLEITTESEAFDVQTLAALLRLELETPITLGPFEPAQEDRPRVLRLSLAREGAPERWRVTVVRSVSTEASSAVDLRDVPEDARGRALALAIGEIVRSGPAPNREVVRPFVWRLSADAALGVRAYPTSGTTLMELLAGTSAPLFEQRGWRGRAEVGVQFGESDDPLGSVSIFVPAARVGVRYARDASDVWFDLGPDFEFGYARASGVPASGALGMTADGWIATAMISSTARFRLGEWTGVEVGLKLGHAIRGLQLRAGDRALAGISGPIIGLTLGATGDLVRRFDP